MEPGAGSNEYPATEPIWPIVAIGSTVIRSIVEVPVWANRRNSNVNRNLSRCYGHTAHQRNSESSESKRFPSRHKFSSIVRLESTPAGRAYVIYLQLQQCQWLLSASEGLTFFVCLSIPEPTRVVIIQTFGMAPHPEGGWYTETFRAPSAPGRRSAVTAIYFLLQEGQRSHWHSVDASEIWLWHGGSAIRLCLSPDGQQSETVLLGSNIAAGERPQAVVPADVWQSAESLGAWSLVSCIVAPGFEFSGFTMAPPEWSPGPATK